MESSITPKSVSIFKKMSVILIAIYLIFEPNENNAHFFDVLDKKTFFEELPPPSPFFSLRQKNNMIYFAINSRAGAKQKVLIGWVLYKHCSFYVFSGPLSNRRPSIPLTPKLVLILCSAHRHALLYNTRFLPSDGTLIF